MFRQAFLIFNFKWILGSFIIVAVVADSENKGRGFGEQYNWYSLEDGLAAAKDSNKPVMLIVHELWCGACKALKPQIAASKEIEDLSTNFIMVNVENDEVKEEQYTPDGGYIPRILFIDPSGKVHTEFYNEDGNPSYKYFYSNADSVAMSMKKVKGSLKIDGRILEEL